MRLALVIAFLGLVQSSEVGESCDAAVTRSLLQTAAGHSKKVTQVVVVGSGMSGLSAARTLLDNWPTTAGSLTVTVWEANNRTGGRTFTKRSQTGFGTISGAEVDFGASWIHGSCATHPITRIKDVLKLGGFVTLDSLDEVHQCTGTQSNKCPEKDDNGFENYAALLAAAQAAAKKSAADLSIWAAMQGLSNGGGRDNPLMQYHIANALEFDAGASEDVLSAKYFGNDEKFSGQETLLLKGYGQIPDALIQGSVSLSAACANNMAPNVKAVDATSQKNIVVLLDKQVTSVTFNADTDKVAVRTNTGESIEADHVVLAVPLGVLKAGTITFSPTLPAPTQTAISRIGFGNVMKIGISFDTQFWSKDVHYFGVALAKAGIANAEKFTYFLNAGAAAGRPILFTFVFGSSAMEVEKWTDDQVWTGVRANLVAIFGESQVGKAKKLGMWRSSWGSDPLFRGAYSYAALGSKPQDWTELHRSTMDGRLHFAGEHTSKEYRGTVHGAFLTGQRAACEIFDETSTAPLYPS